MRNAAASFVLTALVALAACPGPEPVSEPEPVPFEQLGFELARTFCEAAPDCYRPLAELWGDPENCVQGMREQLESGEVELIRQAVERGTVVYDPEAMGRCLEEMARTCVLDARLPLEICQQAVAGQVEAGGECSLHLDCAGDDYCQTGLECPGTCTPRAREGEPCRGVLCEHGTRCEDDVCVPPLPHGAECESSSECAPGFVCGGAMYYWGGGGQSGACMTYDEASAGEGEPCYFLASMFCAEGLRCVIEDPQTRDYACRPAPASGGPCRSGYPDPCPWGEYCDEEPIGSFEGTCRALPVDGEPCTRPMLLCAHDHVCNDDDVCERKHGLGEPCTERRRELCFSDYCRDGVCAVRTRCE